MIQRTLAIIKPNAVRNNWIGRIINLIEEDGLRIVNAKMTTMTAAGADCFYAEHAGKPFLGDLISFMTSGPVMLLVLEGENAVKRYRDLMGSTDPSKAAPGTIRSLYGESLNHNSVHGSDSVESAEREVYLCFGEWI